MLTPGRHAELMSVLPVYGRMVGIRNSSGKNKGLVLWRASQAAHRWKCRGEAWCCYGWTVGSSRGKEQGACFGGCSMRAEGVTGHETKAKQLRQQQNVQGLKPPSDKVSASHLSHPIPPFICHLFGPLSWYQNTKHLIPSSNLACTLTHARKPHNAPI